MFPICHGATLDNAHLRLTGTDYSVRAYHRGLLQCSFSHVLARPIRLKGRVWIPGKTLPLQIQMVGPRLDSWYEAAPNHSWQPVSGSGLELVVIGLESDAAEQLERCLQPA